VETRFRVLTAFFLVAMLLEGRATSGSAVDALDRRVAASIEKALQPGMQAQAFRELESLGCAAVPALIRRMDDRRPLRVQSITLTNDFPGAFEGARHYSPELMVDALAAILNQLTGQSFGSIENGGTDEERAKEVAGWRAFLKTTPPEELCGVDAVSQYITRLLREHSPGGDEHYAGTYGPLSAPLERRAARHFPRHRFVLADFFYVHVGHAPVRMLLVLDGDSGEVRAHTWTPWYAGHSQSFADLLRGYTPESEASAIELVTTLAQAIAATSEQFTVGKVTREGPGIVAPLLTRDRIWRSMRVPYSRQEGFGRLRMIHPVSGEGDPSIPFVVTSDETAPR
jgi:hypothetical protein